MLKRTFNLETFKKEDGSRGEDKIVFPAQEIEDEEIVLEYRDVYQQKLDDVSGVIDTFRKEICSQIPQLQKSLFDGSDATFLLSMASAKETLLNQQIHRLDHHILEAKLSYQQNSLEDFKNSVLLKVDTRNNTLKHFFHYQSDNIDYLKADIMRQTGFVRYVPCEHQTEDLFALMDI